MQKKMEFTQKLRFQDPPYSSECLPLSLYAEFILKRQQDPRLSPNANYKGPWSYNYTFVIFNLKVESRERKKERNIKTEKKFPFYLCSGRRTNYLGGLRGQCSHAAASISHSVGRNTGPRLDIDLSQQRNLK